MMSAAVMRSASAMMMVVVMSEQGAADDYTGYSGKHCGCGRIVIVRSRTGSFTNYHNLLRRLLYHYLLLRVVVP